MSRAQAPGFEQPSAVRARLIARRYNRVIILFQVEVG